MKTALFVYGTLQSEQSNSHYCRNAISIEPAIVCGKLYQLSAGYPALQVSGLDIIHGELVTFSNFEQEIPPIDRLEEAPNYYRRIMMPAKKSDGTIISAWVYVMQYIPFSAQYLPKGIWSAISKPEVALCQ